MCGISGFYKFSSSLNSDSIRLNLTESLHHRGPDGNGFFIEEPICLVHNRLSIIDLSENGAQPLYNEDQTLVLICNGEIYNYQALREELLNLGHKFRSKSDCEVILHLYEENKGNIAKTLNRLIGMFAFAIWDKKSKKLILARDRVGIKPLYYSLNEKSFSFSSEIKPLVSSGLASSEMDFSSFYEYFNLGYIPEPNTIYQSIKALSPGSFLELSNNCIIEENKYWSLPTQIDKNLKKEGEVLEALDSLLNQVVKDHLIADVKVGSFLSGGIDSSLVSYYSAKAQDGIPTFTASFSGEPEDESLIAIETSRKIHSTSYQFNVQTDFFNNFESHFGFLDQPFGVSSALSLSRISALAKPIVKVVLSGDGADELFGGYERHSNFADPPQLRFLPFRIRRRVFQAVYLLTSKESLKLAVEEMNRPQSLKYAKRLALEYGYFGPGFLDSVINSKVDTERYFNRVEKIWSDYQGEDLINRMLYTDIQTSLVDEMLFKADRMTMHQSIEGRVPFLDHRIVEFAMQIPSSLKKRNGIGKLPLRALVSKYLGESLAERKKTGFNSPLKKLLQNDRKTQNRFEDEIEFLLGLEFFDKGKLKNYSRKIESGEFIASQAFGLVAMADYLRRA